MTTHEEEANTAPSDASTASEVDRSPLLQDPNLALSGIEEPGDTDVLCGRGGAALRHPGNQTYRRLVHLNKGLYITCLKAEKLKISRSIVAAIREQNGRFLEKNSKKMTWYDIGDKKAMEKTSQALREGQPKLRQKIVELGGGAAGAAALLETQFPSNSSMQSQGSAPGVYPGFNPGYDSHSAAAAAAAAAQHQQHHAAGNTSAYAHHVAPAMAPSLHSMSAAPGMHNMPPRPSFRDTTSPEYFQRLTLIDDEQMMRPSLTPRGAAAAMALGVEESTLSAMNSFSNFGLQDNNNNAMSMEATRSMQYISPPHVDEESIKPRPIRPQHQHESDVCDAAAVFDSDQDCSPEKSQVDRRGVFAKMKFYEPEAQTKFARQQHSGRSLGHSGRSLGHSGRSLGEAISEVHFTEGASCSSNMSGSTEAENNKVPTVAEVFGGGSRRSIMSGLSRISDADNSIISDLSRKIGNVSTRSLLSEISGMDEESVDVTIDTRDLTTPSATMDMGTSAEK